MSLLSIEWCLDHHDDQEEGDIDASLDSSFNFPMIAKICHAFAAFQRFSVLIDS